MRSLKDIVDETKITSEEYIEALNGVSIQGAIVKATHLQGEHRFHVMAFGRQDGNELPGQILVQENFQAGRGSFSASSARTPRTDSVVKLG